MEPAPPLTTTDDTLPSAAGSLPATRLTFRLPRPRPGRHAAWLRVGGIDSQPVLRDPITRQLSFDPAQTVEVPS